MIREIFTGPGGIITEMHENGAGITIRFPDGRTETLARYGVWKFNGRKFQVVLTTDDYDEAVAEATRG